MKSQLLVYFKRYVSVGVINTALHWVVFFFGVWLLGFNSAWANLLGFTIAASFSFFANANYTFQVKATKRRYLLFMAFMALLSFQTGWGTDKLGLPKIVALISFSALSLILGFVFSRYIVFNNSD